MSGVDHVRFYASKWRSGCLMLSIEAEGLYIRIASFRWDAGVKVPCDRKKASLLLRVNYNKYIKVLDELIAQKLVRETDDGLVIERAETEYQAAVGAMQTKRVSRPEADRKEGTAAEGQPGATGDHTVNVTPQVTPLVTGVVTPPVEAKNDQSNQGASIDTDREEGKKKESGVVDASAMNRVLNEARPILRDGGMSAGLMGSASEIAKWLQAGCDLEMDVLPIIRAAVAKGGVVGSWKFFTQAVVNAKAAREIPLPGASKDAAAEPAWKLADSRGVIPGKKGSIADALARRAAKAAPIAPEIAHLAKDALQQMPS
jgi:hypothetical protein